VEGFEVFENREPVASHVLVSEAHVDVIVDQSSAKLTFVEFAIEVVGFA